MYEQQLARAIQLRNEEKKKESNHLLLKMVEQYPNDAFIGLGSTYRTLGQYKKAQSTFLKGIDLFPTNKALQVFYAMTLYNLDEHSKAMELLLECLLHTTRDAEILSYKNAIHFYAHQLDKVWQ